MTVPGKPASHDNNVSRRKTITNRVLNQLSIRWRIRKTRAGEDLDWWEDLILHDGPVIDGGYVAVPKGPGLGIELNPDVAQAHLAEGEQWWN